MKANELRIGNHIESGTITDTFENGCVRAINNKKGRILAPEEIKPIPLTPEWLERAGFENKIDGLISTKWHVGTNPVTHDYLFDITWLHGFDYPFHRNGHFKIQYVHQLQNLYHALTGEELTFS